MITIILLLMVPLWLLYPIITTIIATYPTGVKFYFSVLYGPGSVDALTANIYVAIMISLPFLYMIQIMKMHEWDILTVAIGLVASFFLFLLTATGMYYPELHRVYAPIAILLCFLFLLMRSRNLFFGSGFLFFIVPFASGILTMITWQIFPNDLWFSIGQLLLFASIHYELQIAHFLFISFYPRRIISLAPLLI